MNDWIILRFRQRSSQGLLLEYQDDDGSVWPDTITPVTGQQIQPNGQAVAVELSFDLGDRIRQNLIELRTSAGHEERAPLPLFVARTDSMAWADAEELVRGVLREVGVALDDLQLIRLTGDVTGERKAVLSVADAISLPLVIGWQGRHAQASLEKLKGREWITGQVAESGLRIRSSVVRSDPHILVCSRPLLTPSTARLVIWLSSGPLRLEPKLAPGQSLIRIERMSADTSNAFLKALVYGVIHDKPLHGALHGA
ncbi:MAG: hypothetical protein JWN02_512, partial [Acidobacteria bacterium]|nr:hypothetical protein [Acidobacteriota bacterium]